MENPENPYELALTDLRRKRALIDQAIKALEELGGAAPSGEVAMVEGAKGSAKPVNSGDLLGKSIVESVKIVLAASRKPLGNADLVDALEAGGVVLQGNKANTVGSVLNRRFNNEGDIVRVKRGQWGLREWYPNRRFGNKDEEEDQPSENPGKITRLNLPNAS